jgi:hypothetical protein
MNPTPSFFKPTDVLASLAPQHLADHLQVTRRVGLFAGDTGANADAADEGVRVAPRKRSEARTFEEEGVGL